MNCVTRIVLFFIALATLSCNTVAHFDMQVLVPAEFKIDSLVKKIAIIDRSYDLNDRKKYLMIENRKLLQIDTLAADECIFGFIETIKASGRFDTANIANYRIPNQNNDTLFDPLAWETIQEIKQKTGAEIIFSLESIATNGSHRVVPLPFEYLGIRWMEFAAIWKIYRTDTMCLLFECMDIDTAWWETRDVTEGIAFNNLPSVEDAQKGAGYYAGMHFANRIVPNWQSTQRQYFITLNPDMRKAARKARDNDWRSAAIIWKMYTQHKYKPLASQAAYNMALACELEGKLDLALDWAIQSYNKRPNQISKQYVDTLSVRRFKLKLVEQQLRH